MSLEVMDALGRIPESDRHGADLFAAVREGLLPFKAHQIYTYLEYDIDYHRYWVIIEVIFKNGYRLNHKEFVDARDIAANPDMEMAKIAVLMLDAFRNRENFSIAPLICLGAN